MTNVASYTGGSFVPDKAGELVAALHNQLVCRTLRRCVMGKVFRPLSAHGLYMHRAIGIIHITVTISEASMGITATNIFEGTLCPGFLCACMLYFTDKLKKH